MKTFKNIIEILTSKNETISTMESCTGGGVANAITNIEGASSVLKFSAVTYSNEYKIKMGVDKDILDKYSVYSKETARSMAKTISNYTNSTYGIGITGKLNRPDKNNMYNDDNKVYICIYENENYHDYEVTVTRKTRVQNKNLIIEEIIKYMEDLLK